MLEGLDLLSPYGLRTSFYIISSNSVVQLELPDLMSAFEKGNERNFRSFQDLILDVSHISAAFDGQSKSLSQPIGEENRFLLLLMGGDTKSHSRGAAGWEERL